MSDVWIVLIGVSAGWVLSVTHPGCDPLAHQEAQAACSRSARLPRLELVRG